MNIAYIQCRNEELGKDYCGEAPYALIFNDEIIGNHYCSNRNFANHDLTVWKLEALEKYNIDKVLSNEKEVWSKISEEINEDTNINFQSANYEYEKINCIE